MHVSLFEYRLTGIDGAGWTMVCADLAPSVSRSARTRRQPDHAGVERRWRPDRHHHWSTASMKTKTLVASAATLAVTLSAGAARATDDPPPPPVSSTLIARGTASELRVRDHSIGLTLTARQPTDVALVKATIIPGGQTGWHMHPGPSVVIVQAGTLTMRAPHRRHCMEAQFEAGEVFEHPSGVHNFIAGTGGVEFYVSYFVPAGSSPLLTPASPPAECA